MSANFEEIIREVVGRVGINQYLSHMFDVVTEGGLSREEFIKTIVAIESNAYDNGIQMAQEYED